MHAYLSKKIAIPNNTKLNCIAWHKIEGFVAIGGEKGLLKVLKLDSGHPVTLAANESDSHGVWSVPSQTSASTGSVGSRSTLSSLPSNLSMNLTLEGHSEPVEVIVWNENLDKLTTSDSNGVIIVWLLYKGVWYEEMINNRNKSTVTGMAWSFDGNKICIVYDDGAVIVGAANGNRIWGKELKDVNLRGVQWSPDANMLLFNVGVGQLHLYDNQGNFMMRVRFNSIADREYAAQSTSDIITLQWYDGRCGFSDENAPVILVCYTNGDVYLLRDVNDEEPITFNVGCQIRFACWNQNASMIAIGCEKKEKTASGDRICILFYNNFGKMLHSLKLPGRKMTACAWEGNGLRLAITVDSHIYFANVHPEYKWCFFKRTLVFSTNVWTPTGVRIVFWDINSSLTNSLYVKRLFCMAACGNLCVLAVQLPKSEQPHKYMLLLCDTGCTIVDEKYLDLEPHFITMNSSLVVVTSNTQFILWQYNNLRSNVTANVRKREYIYHINERVTGEETLLQSHLNELAQSEPIENDIQCVTCSETVLLIGRRNGDVHQYELPHVSLVNKYSFIIKGISQMIRINCNSTKAAFCCDGQLVVFGLRSDPGFMRGELIDGESSGESGRLERKDVWDICWAADNPHMLTIMEKARLYVFRGSNPEEPITCSGYLCSFKDLEIKTVLLDLVIANPDNLVKDLIVDLEVKSLRDTRELLMKVGLKEARQFIVDNPHPRLWRLLSEAALKQLDLVTAEIACVYCQDLVGIEFINQLNRNRNQNLIKAEIATYTKDFDEAERLYMENDRCDLVLELYKKLGDWFKVKQIMNSILTTEVRTREIYNGIGYYYADRYNWPAVKEYFYQSQNNEMLALTCYHLEQYYVLEKMIDELDRNDQLLLKLGKWLASVGLCRPATMAFAKYGEVNKAVSFCAKLHEWELAVKLAKEFDIPEMDNVLNKYVRNLVQENQLPQGIEVLQTANYYLETAFLSFENGKELAKIDPGNINKIKDWFVYGAMMIDKHRRETNIIVNSPKYDELIANRWRYAFAYHLYGIAQVCLLSGETRKAFIAAVKLREYDNYISEWKVYSLIALTSQLCQVYSMCSKAFVKLLASDEVPESDKVRLNNLAIDIFKNHPPKDKHILRRECVSCETMIPDWYSVCPSCDMRFPTCVITGQPIMDPKLIWTCSNCLESADIREMNERTNCELCEAPKLTR